MSETTVVPTTDPTPEEEPAAQPEPERPRALAIRPPMQMAERGIMLRSFEDLQRFAKMVHAEGAAPKGMNTVGQVAVAIQAGMEAGLSPMHALQAVVVINGVTSWRGQAAVGLIRSDPRCRYIKHWSEGTGDQMKGVCVSRRVGADREERNEFSVQDAKTAGLWQRLGRNGDPTPWVTYPGRQLMWRAVGFHGKDWWSDVLGGFPIDEEVRDYTDVESSAPASAPALPPPSTPDPLLAALTAKVQAVPVVVSVASPAASSEEAIHGPATSEPPPPSEVAKEQPPPGCMHPLIPPSRLKPGKTLVCPSCGEELTGDPVQKDLLT